MKILVVGGTRFFGIHMVNELLKNGHEVVIATRGRTEDHYGNKVSRIIVDRNNPDNLKEMLGNLKFDVVIDKIAYCSNDIKNIMDIIHCNKYIYMSSTAVYEPKHWDTKEDDFDPLVKELVWCNRSDYPYDEIKRQAECALWQKYPDKKWVSVRYPFVIGRDDYTNRLHFYVEHVMKAIPMNIDNMNCQMGFIRSDEAGKLMAFLVDKEYTGAINGSSAGTVSIREILSYVEKKTGRKAMIDGKGESAPYNGEPEYSINTEKAQKLGFQFTTINDWLWDLVDYYIQLEISKQVI